MYLGLSVKRLSPNSQVQSQSAVTHTVSQKLRGVPLKDQSRASVFEHAEQSDLKETPAIQIKVPLGLLRVWGKENSGYSSLRKSEGKFYKTKVLRF